jgi:glycosyltransferase involved in cell wall biosynthesis
MKILWVSDSPTSPTGYGNVTRYVCAGLAEYGHQVSILGWQTDSQAVRWQNCTLYPLRYGPHVADAILGYLRQLQPDVLVMLSDVRHVRWSDYVTNPILTKFLHSAGIVWAFYYPIACDRGDNRLPEHWLGILKTVDLPIAVSKYGADLTQASGVIPAYIPHGVDTKVFHPPANKCLAKQAFGYEGQFVILSDVRNNPRKLLPRTLDIFRRFAADKDDVLLHLHCDPDDSVARTPYYFYDVRSDIAFLNLTSKVRLTPGMSLSTGGLPITQLAQIYQAADVHLLASGAEGFGIPTLQAAASGVVPIASDYSASRELVLGHGEAIRVRHFLSDEFGQRHALIDIDDAVKKLERLYRDRELLAAKAQRARCFAEAYDYERLIPQWHELLEREVPRRRVDLRSRAEASRSTMHPPPATLARDLPQAIASFPQKVRVSGVEREVEEFAESFQDTQDQYRLSIPVTLPLTDPRQAKARIRGCVYAASASDVPIVQALAAIFPELKVWSTVPLALGLHPKDGEPLRAKVVRANGAAYRSELAKSTLALDTGSYDPLLAVQAAQLGVPCLGLARSLQQLWLWPELSLAGPDLPAAAELGRWMLTDQGRAADLCRQAYQRLSGTCALVNEREKRV